MRLNPKSYLLILPALACFMFTNFPVTAQELNMTGKLVTVYTTADSTNLRLTQTGKLTFTQCKPDAVQRRKLPFSHGEPLDKVFCFNDFH